ncbi:MAG: 16S rRNA (adenine(1518)-N(6)/adenine(1519)-N(6))-dimethyltransferase RsmA [Gammaproteobacteria bacterium]|nr:16S rRNA (adenine(1518)-N(6)/adenine(1519)-N(6))-dimethyltransferase RsmA [Gammaproteobacteria bacterium]
MPLMRARKRFGQNFLTDPGVVDRLMAAIDPKREERIIEIGPGHGAITAPLLASGCALEVIEIDRDLAADLGVQFPELRIHEGDALKINIAPIVDNARVVGNLPYNISTPLLFRLYPLVSTIKDMHFMLQREVVDRITASPSTADYGRCLLCPTIIAIPRNCSRYHRRPFHPARRSLPAIVRLKAARHGHIANDITVLEQLVTRAFSNRRKTIRNGFKGVLDSERLESLGIDPGCDPRI